MVVGPSKHAQQVSDSAARGTILARCPPMQHGQSVDLHGVGRELDSTTAQISNSLQRTCFLDPLCIALTNLNADSQKHVDELRRSIAA